MKYFPPLVASLGFAAFAAFAALASPPLTAADFPQAESDLRPDPDVRYGNLPNGLGYVIMVNHLPEDKASFRLVVNAGSFNETADQQGLAHFLAHMAYRGSTNYPPGTLVQTLKGWGMSADPEEDSETDFDHTSFLLELPDTRASTLKDGCRIFADFASGLLLRDDQIEAERSEILTEKLARASMAYSDQIAEMRFTLPESLIPNRLPIGLGKVIEHAGRDQFVDFYNTWYRPERMTVVAVGDFDPNDVEAIIRDAFGDLRDRAPAQPEASLGDIPIVSGLQVKFLPEPGTQSVKISIETIRPYFHEADTAQKRLEYLQRGLAFAMLNRRLANRAHGPDAPFVSAAADVGEQFDFVHNASLQLVCRPDRWRVALAAGEQELRRALQYGFQPAELAEIVQTMRRSLQQGVDNAPARTSKRLADSIVRSLVRKQVFTSPAENLAVYSTDLDRISAKDCETALQEAWAAKGTYLLVSGDIALDHPEQDIAAAYTQSRAVAVEPLPPVVEESFPYTSFGVPGEVVSRNEISDLGITEVIFSNGVRLNLKTTKFEAGKIEISVRVGGGALTEPADAEPGLARFTEGVFIGAGLGKLSANDISRILAGKSAGIDFRVGDDAFVLGGATDAADLPTELQLITAYIADPGYRPEVLERARLAIPRMYRALDQAPDGVLETKIARVIANGDPRFGLPAESDLMMRNLDEMRAWIGPQLARGPVEVAMVGDFDREAAIAAVSRTLGALPRRDPKAPYSAERVISIPEKPVPETFPAPPGVWKSAVIMIWPTTDGRDDRVAHRLGLLAAIFTSRLKAAIHDETGENPPPIARSIPSTTYSGFGTITVDVTCDPLRAIDDATSILTVAATLQKKGVSDAEVDRAKQSAIEAINESAMTNDYWLNSVLAEAQEEPQRLDWARKRYDDVNGITASDINYLADAYLDPTRAFRFLVTPQQSAP